MNATKGAPEPLCFKASRVGAGRPLRDRPYPPLANRACTFPRTRLSPSPGYSCTRFRGSISTPHFSFRTFSQAPLACFLPNSAGFASVTWVYPAVGTPEGSAPAITAVRRVIPCLRNHVGITPCLGHPAFSAELRCSVLQVFRSSLFPRNEGLPEELDRGKEMQNPSIFWSSVSAIFRWRPQGGQRD